MKDTIVVCRLCETRRAHQRSVELDGLAVVVVECTRCDRASCRRCGHSLPGRAVACAECGHFLNR